MSKVTRTQDQSQRCETPDAARPQAQAMASARQLHPALRLQRTIGNQAVLRLKGKDESASLKLKFIQRKEDAAGARAAENLKSQKIGASGDEQPLVLPDKDELTDEWGAAETDFGSDQKMEEFIEQVLRRFAQREKHGDPKVADSLGSKQVLADEYRRMVKFVKENTKGKEKAGSIRNNKWNWLSAMPSRIDAATTEQQGINFKWAFSPYLIKAPQGEQWKPIPEAIQDTGSFHKISDAMEAFLLELKPMADKAGYQFKVENRQSHGNGHSVDMYLLKEQMDQGFWNPDRAAGFLKLFGEAAKTAKVRWHVIYNDPRVEKEVNLFYRDEARKEGKKGDVNAKVAYGGSYRLNKEGGIEQTYHGPSPLLLHFHLDVVW